MTEPAASAPPSAAPSTQVPLAATTAASTEPAPAIEDLTPPPNWWQTRGWAWFLLLVAAAGLGLALMLWQKLSGIQEELARRSLDTGAQAISARTMAQQAPVAPSPAVAVTMSRHCDRLSAVQTEFSHHGSAAVTSA